MNYDDLICEVADHLNISYGTAKELLELMEWGVQQVSRRNKEEIHNQMLAKAGEDLPYMIELARIGLQDFAKIKAFKKSVEAKAAATRSEKAFNRCLGEVVNILRNNQ